MSSVRGYILLDIESGRPVVNRYGMATLYTGLSEIEADAADGQSILVVRTASRPAADAPRRGRRPKQQLEDS